MEKQKGTFFSKQIGLFFFLLIIWGTGCALQADMYDLQKDVEEIKKGDPTSRQQLKEIDKLLKEKISNLQKTQVDIISKIDHLSSEIEMIRGRLDENDHRISEISKKIDDEAFRTKDLNARVDLLEGRPQKGLNNPSRDKGVPSDESKRSPSGREPDRRKMGSDDKSGTNPSEVYSQAYNDYSKGNYDLAILGFQSYLSQFPNTSQAQDAQYWIGESFYGKEDYQKAIDAFEKFIGRYSRNEKVGSALLKEGYSYNELGDKVRSRAFLKKVIDEFPLSEEAKLARAKISEIK